MLSDAPIKTRLQKQKPTFVKEFPYIQTRNLPDWSDPADRNNFDLEAYRNAYDYRDNGSVSLSPTFNELMHGTLDEGMSLVLVFQGTVHWKRTWNVFLSDFHHRLRNNRAGWLVDPIEAIATHFEIPPAEIGRFSLMMKWRSFAASMRKKSCLDVSFSNVGTVLMSKWRQLIRNIRPQATLRVPDERSTLGGTS